MQKLLYLRSGYYDTVYKKDCLSNNHVWIIKLWWKPRSPWLRSPWNDKSSLFRLWKGMRSTVQTNWGKARLLQGLPPETPEAPLLSVLRFIISLFFCTYLYSSGFFSGTCACHRDIPRDHHSLQTLRLWPVARDYWPQHIWKNRPIDITNHSEPDFRHIKHIKFIYWPCFLKPAKQNGNFK